MEVESQEGKDGEAKKDGEEEEKKPEEPNHYIANNPFRVIDHQIPHLVYLSENRYEPILKERKKGIVFLFDNKEGDDVDYYSENDILTIDLTKKDEKKDDKAEGEKAETKMETED